MPKSGEKITLDDLFAAKRAERPNEAFWNRFDKELDYKRRRLVQRQIVDESSFKTLVGRRFSRYAAISCTVGCGALALFVSLNFNLFEQAQSPAAKAEAPRLVVANEDTSFSQSGLREFSTLASAPRPRVVVATKRQAEPSRVESPAPAVAAAARPQKTQTVAVAAVAARQSTSARPATYTTGYFNPETVETVDSALAELGAMDMDRELSLGKYADPMRSFDLTGRERLRPVVTSQRDSYDAIEDFLNNRGSGSQHSLDALTVRF